nr:DUF998 domain-containing protein [Nitrosomonas nitrosa]
MHLPTDQFYKQHPYVGPIFWITSLQFFVVQMVVARGWTTGYSIVNNTISDLGITACGAYASRYVCSPWYSWMNASFVFLGFSMLLGSLLLYHQFAHNFGTKIGFTLMGIAGFGTVLVGLFPANTAPTMHGIGAFLPFFFGNLGLIFFGLYLSLKPTFRFFTLLSGVFSLVAFLLFAFDIYLGLGVGGMERLVAHPQTFWMIIFGFYVSGRLLQNKNPLPTSR